MWATQPATTRSIDRTSQRTRNAVAGAEGTPQWLSPLLQQRVAQGARFQNVALSFASDIMRSEAARIDAQLVEDYMDVMRGNVVYIHNFMCAEDDMTLYDRLKAELVAATGATLTGKGGLIDWSRHQVFDNPTDISKTFNDVVDMLAEYFDVDVYATRLNYYRDGNQWKPQHHDSHAYGDRAEREDFTVGLTLGSNRGLLFVHEISGRQFEFPQKNGDCFAFTGAVNKTFTHGVPRARKPVGDRFSIIAWGRRRSLNARNGGAPDIGEGATLASGKSVETMEDAIAAAKELVAANSHCAAAAPPAHAGDGSTGNGSAKVTQKKKKKRLQ